MNLAWRDVRHGLGRFILTCIGLSLLLGGLHPAAQQGFIQMRHGLPGQITDRQLILRMDGLPAGNEIGRQLTGYGAFLTGTAFNHENTGHLTHSIGFGLRWSKIMVRQKD